MHLDARQLGVEEGAMLPEMRREIGADQPVDVLQHIAVEGRRHARRIGVGGLQHMHRLGQVDADEQASAVLARPQHLAHAREQLHRVARLEVADG
ncbi:hypothetical protein SDC9_177456 [bioreactor metagenome]|uniref:Uncharacterized protein n=1 Tax=bioreactor metagenome TaxID=1076179 RepID=A0A645GW67_9ZZZZ